MEKLLYYLKWIPSQLITIYYFILNANNYKKWDYNLTDTQKWWKNLVIEDMKKKGLTIDEDGHTKRIGDGEL